MTRRPIHQLSQSLVNRIAAGEVIERPASVVKELVDNAIDSGASHIVVEIEDGGRELIRVIDNGGGIPVSELGMAFAPHATSKLLTDEDLFNILTMGFRGEALASIGSVSHARVLSRIPGSDAAYEIFNRGGQLSDPQASAGNVGTTVEVRNLFFNVPARRKFLKGTQTELGHITDMVLRLSLSQPGVAFEVHHNGRKVRDYPVTSEMDRLLCAWPEDYREQRLPLAVRDAEIQLRGVIGLPELASPTQKYQHLYINGRPIRDKSIQHALREAYRGLTEPGRHPAAILLLEIPPGDVDVNVHPTKSEVRFKDSSRLHGLVMASVREVLLGNDLTPIARPRSVFTPTIQQDEERKTMQSQLASFFKTTTHLPTFEPRAASTPSPALPAMNRPASVSNYSSVPISRLPNLPVYGSINDQDIPARTSNPNSDSPQPIQPQVQERALQLHNSYLVVESDDGMLIIDQHALHERILYEELLAKVTQGPLESQRMLIPMTMRASTRQIALLEQINPMLKKLGIDVEPFGPDTLAIQGFPSFLDRLDPSEFVTELLEKGEQELLDLHEEELLHEVLDMMSCKAAIKAGDPLTPQEITTLLLRKDLIDRSSNCPHGRPTMLRMSLKDLEKQFKRTGF